MGKYIAASDVAIHKFKRISNIKKKKKALSRSKIRRVSNDLISRIINSDTGKSLATVKNLRTYSYKKGNILPQTSSRTEENYKDVLTFDNTNTLLEDKKNYEHFSRTDFYFHVIDEIALEGLDGITLEAFWKRINVCFEKTLIFFKRTQDIIWKMIRNNENLEFYELEEPRPELFIYDRYEYVYGDDGLCLELEENLFPDIYPYALITNSNVKGSCKTFHTRKFICDDVRQMELEEVVEKYGNKLVIVADQDARKKAIIYEGTDPILDMNDTEYAILERIGRSRYLGEVTRGNMSLMSLIPDSKSLHHYKKNLIKYDLIVKQSFYLRNLLTEKLKHGRLLQLIRFYQLRKTKTLTIVEQIINVLKSQPDNRIEYTELRKTFPSYMLHSVAKVIKSEEFKNYVRPDVLVKYRDLHPGASVKEWKLVTKNKERTVRVLELKDSRANVVATWHNSDDSDDEPQAEFEKGYKIINTDTLREIYTFILSSGKMGATLQNVISHCEIELYTLRLILRKLISRNKVYTVKQDVGKQRYIRYISKCFENFDTVVNFTPPPPPQRNPSILARIISKQTEALKRVPKEKVYTIEQAELDKIMIEEDEFQSIREVKGPLNVQCRSLVNFVKEEQEKMDIEYTAKFLTQGKRFNVRLTFKQFVSMLKPDMNKIILDNLQSYTGKPTSNIQHYCIEIRKIDEVSKLFLIKLMLGDIIKRKSSEFYLDCIEESIEGKKNLREVIVEKTDLEEKKAAAADSPSIPSSSEVATKNADKKAAEKPSALAIKYMGLHPLVVFDEVDKNGVRVLIEMSTPPKNFMLENSVYIPVGEVTTRVMSRIKIVLDEVKREKVIEDSHRMSKIIEEKELAEGYDRRIDRKSVFRIFKKLIDEGYVKIYRMTISHEATSKSQTFLCDVDVKSNHHVIKTCQDQMKLRFFMGVSRKRPATATPVSTPPPAKKPAPLLSAFHAEDVRESIKQFNKASERELMAPSAYKLDSQVGKVYGFRPKFIRMQILHEFLHYLLYFYDATERLNTNSVEAVFQRHKIIISAQDLENLPPMYVPEISWKSFINPRPYHKGWGSGWALMADVVLRLPLSIFVKLHNVNYHDNEMFELLHHPVKRHFLVTTLSERMKRILFFKRRYLQSVHDILCRLAFTGLVQFGPQKQKEKDQVFIFLNKNTSLYDTTSSEPSYNKVTEKEYTKLSFRFNTQNDIDNYWYQMWNICMNTKLGARNVMQGKSVTFLDVSIKPELNKTLKPQTNESVIELDNGELPGDKRGAGGLDSLLWPHISRNWLWMSKAKKTEAGSELTILKREQFDSILTHAVPFNQLKTATRMDTKLKIHPKKQYLPVPKFRINDPIKTSKKVPRMVRKFEIIRTKKSNSGADHLDKILLKKLGKVRVQWDAGEDKFLYVNKAVLLLICPKYPKKNYIPFTIQRDVLHMCIPRSRNKCSNAVKRRMLILNRDDNLFRSLEGNYLNLMKIKPIEHYFKYIAYDLSKNGLTNYKEKQVIAIYMFIMAYLTKHLDEVKNLLLGASTNFEYFTVHKLKENEDNFVYYDEENDQTLSYKEPDNEEDVRKELVKSIVHSNLGCQGHHPAWAYQLFRTYQKYPDNVLHNAVEELKQQQLITLKPNCSKGKKKRWNNPFQLSSYYIYMQACTFGTVTVKEAYKTFHNALVRVEPLDFSMSSLENKKYGQMLAYNEIFTFWPKTMLDFDIPEYSHILDPSIEDHSELVDELAIRHQIKIKRMVMNSEKDQEHTRKQQTTKHATISSIEPEEETPSKSTEKIVASPKADVTSPNRPEIPLDLTVDEGVAQFETTQSNETIDKLKSWISHCISADLERRSPSPEFLTFENESVKPLEEETPHARKIDVVKQIDVEVSESKDCDNEVENINNSIEEIDRDIQTVPTLEEIKQAMMDTTSTQGRSIPHITEMSSLLNKEAFPERDIDDDTLEKLKRHFISQYPHILDVYLEDLEEFKELVVTRRITDKERIRKFWERLQKNIYVEDPKMDDLSTRLTEIGGDSKDLLLVEEIIKFVKEKGECGASTSELKDSFKTTHNLDLHKLIKFLTSSSVFLQTGVCTIRFVHYIYKHHWVIDSFKLTTQEQELIEKNKDCLKEAKDTIESQLNPVHELKVHIMPWVKVDGTFNIPVFQKWLSCILSHTMDYPKTRLMCLFDKYCYVKQVDLYYLLEILQELGCLKLYAYDDAKSDIFSECTFRDYKEATILDDFYNIFVVPDTTAIITLGSFFEQMEDSEDSFTIVT